MDLVKTTDFISLFSVSLLHIYLVPLNYYEKKVSLIMFPLYLVQLFLGIRSNNIFFGTYRVPFNNA